MKKSRVLIGILFFVLFLFYQYSAKIFSINLKAILNNYYGTIFGSTLIPVLLLLLGGIFLIASIQRKHPKQDYSKGMGKQCPACGQIISQLTTKCPFCGKVQKK